MSEIGGGGGSSDSGIMKLILSYITYANIIGLSVEQTYTGEMYDEAGNPKTVSNIFTAFAGGNAQPISLKIDTTHFVFPNLDVAPSGHGASWGSQNGLFFILFSEYNGPQYYYLVDGPGGGGLPIIEIVRVA